MLPDPLITETGERLTAPENWDAQRGYIKRLAEENIYGLWPGKRAGTRLEITDKSCGSQSITSAGFMVTDDGLRAGFEFSQPVQDDRHAVIIVIAPSVSPEYKKTVLKAGYSLATFAFTDIVPDYMYERQQGVSDADAHARAYKRLSFGTIMAWGWGASLMADALSQAFDIGHFIVAGHSRCGKAALCAGLFDERFEVVAPIGSGCGGAGCLRYLLTARGDFNDEHKTETIGRITYVFPDWFCARFAGYGRNGEPEPYTMEGSFFPIGEDTQRLPLDANTLIAGCAPRAVFSSEGSGDDWANPIGNRLSHAAAQPVFDLLGVPRHNTWHLRPGGHQFGTEDWNALLSYCDFVLFGTQPADDIEAGVYMENIGAYAPFIKD